MWSRRMWISDPTAEAESALSVLLAQKDCLRCNMVLAPLIASVLLILIQHLWRGAHEISVLYVLGACGSLHVAPSVRSDLQSWSYIPLFC